MRHIDLFGGAVVSVVVSDGHSFNHNPTLLSAQTSRVLYVSV